jgi:hypothetical protein
MFLQRARDTADRLFVAFPLIGPVRGVAWAEAPWQAELPDPRGVRIRICGHESVSEMEAASVESARLTTVHTDFCACFNIQINYSLPRT